jgi:hypothetical protein
MQEFQVSDLGDHRKLLESYMTEMQENLASFKCVANEVQCAFFGSLSSADRHLRLSHLQALVLAS